jgi:hypothetical protein
MSECTAGHGYWDVFISREDAGSGDFGQGRQFPARADKDFCGDRVSGVGCRDDF